MTHNKYNGWTNYETWNVKLWIDNDEGSQEFYREQAEQCVKVDKEDAFCSLAEFIRESHEESLPELTGFAADLMNAAMHEVNWEEIAKSIIQDLIEA